MVMPESIQCKRIVSRFPTVQLCTKVVADALLDVFVEATDKLATNDGSTVALLFPTYCTLTLTTLDTTLAAAELAFPFTRALASYSTTETKTPLLLPVLAILIDVEESAMVIVVRYPLELLVDDTNVREYVTLPDDNCIVCAVALDDMARSVC